MNRKLRKEYFNRAFKLHSAGSLEEAKIFYNRIISDNPEDAEVLNLLGIIELQRKKYAEAEKYILKALNSSFLTGKL